VHDLISRHGSKYKFAMSGSSARKLRRLNANLLAGRAIDRRIYALTSNELGKDYDVKKALSIGTLPPITQSPEYAVDILTAYVGTYLTQEIQQETMVTDVAGFHRFLKIAGIMNGEVLNVSGISRDASISRSTTERYFEILVDTLIGFRLPAWHPRAKVREVNAPKFYLFDPGVVRTLNGRVRDPLTELETGKLLETHILNELRAAISYQNLGGDLYYWRTASGVEVDVIWQRGDRAVAIEIKASKTWRRENHRALQELLSAGLIQAAYGVYQGEEALVFDDITVLPVKEFLKQLHSGMIIGYPSISIR
jgi:uncharacterized protein